ncbi:MAG: CPBP family intramembrane metalloprotease [Myxococcota bacterium]|nr:CPBP family intramembrane metalloprotease [Myxococcota bacterium]MDW8362144.1 CPBP family intramembrane glutamic endopeptidase [Myxococcales bacterium]
MRDTPPAARLSWWAAPTLVAVAALVASAVHWLQGTVYAWISGGLARPGVLVERDPLALGVSQAFGVLAALLVAHLLWPAPVGLRERVGLLPVPLRAGALALLAGAGMQLPLSEIASLVEWIAPRPPAERLAALLPRPSLEQPGRALAALLGVVVLAPIAEEVLFRGLLLRGLRERYGTGFALGVSSAMFALAHGLHAAPHALVAAVILGAVVLRTGSIVPAIGMHAATNAVPFLLTAEVARIDGFNVPSERGEHVSWPWLLGSMVLCVATLVPLLVPERARSDRATE